MHSAGPKRDRVSKQEGLWGWGQLCSLSSPLTGAMLLCWTCSGVGGLKGVGRSLSPTPHHAPAVRLCQSTWLDVASLFAHLQSTFPKFIRNFTFIVVYGWMLLLKSICQSSAKSTEVYESSCYLKLHFTIICFYANWVNKGSLFLSPFLLLFLSFLFFPLLLFSIILMQVQVEHGSCQCLNIHTVRYTKYYPRR